MLTTQGWHQRFSQQAQWTAHVRAYLIQNLGLSAAIRCLEVGSGTGAITRKMQESIKASTFGVDISPEMVCYAQKEDRTSHFTNGNADNLPFISNIFDFTYCHFLMLWLKNPLKALQEMRRVTRPGGWVIAFAEPDYSGRLDFPEDLSELAIVQKKSLMLQGANPEIGRRLGGLFHEAGFDHVRISVMGGEWGDPLPAAYHQQEWNTFLMDLEYYEKHSHQAWLESQKFRDRLADLKEMDLKACQSGMRILFVPTFFVHGKVPG
jgi:ubiquinone/menaquinone biosynthesis C-methylase UbiE